MSRPGKTRPGRKGSRVQGFKARNDNEGKEQRKYQQLQMNFPNVIMPITITHSECAGPNRI